MRTISDRQSSLFDVSAYESPPENYYYLEDGVNSELGTEIFLVPNSSDKELGTQTTPVPNSSDKELGTQTTPVPNSSDKELGTDKSLVPNSDIQELGTGKTHRTRAEIYKPSVGILVQTWVKTDWYWYWKYYDIRRKKRSMYLGKKYNKAVSKVQLIGIPADAKLGKIRATPPDTQTQTTEST